MKIEIVKDVLEYNKDQANYNRKIFNKNKVLVLNLLSSPGAGKTSLILETIKRLKNVRIGVIEGDISSTYDAEKVKRYIDEVIQINTGGTCHLNASMVTKAVEKLNLPELDIIFIENVGNLICPVSFDLGEDYKVVISSITEGDDKPVKYPNIFIKSDIIILNKMDMLKGSNFDICFFKQKIGELNPKAPIIKLSCKIREGLEDWTKWLLSRKKTKSPVFG